MSLSRFGALLGRKDVRSEGRGSDADFCLRQRRGRQVDLESRVRGRVADGRLKKMGEETLL